MYSNQPIAEFGWELGETDRNSWGWTYEDGLEALVRETILLDRARRDTTTTNTTNQ